MRLKLSLLLVLIITYSWAQSGTTKTFTGNGTFPVPAGVSSVVVQAWGGGGSGGGASGSPLLFGRGAAGGGGGAYATNTILVTPGTTLNVVVASQTSGTTGAGTAGGNSTITGFESSILAAGGSGGDANNAGGSPVGGIGGKIATSAGATKFAGANGGNGNSWNLLGLLLSSGVGGAGANSGGAGGTAVSGLILSNAPGNAGSPPGGAGSGAINSALGVAQIGGAGAAGRVIISYNCANFSLTSTAATNVCGSTGTTSTVTLTGSAASLPVGSYVVTYNRSSPSATALTANLAVSTAGTGTFTAVGLTTVGSSTIAITKLASEACSSNITTNNTAAVIVSPATVGGTVSGGTTITTGNTSGLLTLSGHTGSVIKWQSSVSPFSVWTDIANTNTTYTSGPLTQTTQFRAVVQSGSCAVANSAATTVTVEALPTIALQAQSVGICSFNNGTTLQTTLGYNGTTGSPVAYSIVWDSSPANSFTPITDAALPSSPITLYFPAATASGTYTGTLTVKNASGAISSPGSVFTVSIERSTSIASAGSIDSVTTSNNVQNTTLAYSATTENPTRYTIDWTYPFFADQPSTPFAFSPSGGIINNIVVPANLPPGTYTGTLRVLNTGTCSRFQTVTLKVNPAVTPTIDLASSTDNRCYAGGIAQTTTLEYSGTTESPTSYSIVWDATPANSFVPVTDAALPASPISIALPAGTAAGTYTGTLTVKNANGAVSNPGSTFTVNLGFLAIVNTNGTIAPVTASSSPQTATLAYSNLYPSSATPPTRYFIDWDQTANNALLADQPTTSFAFSFSGGSINTIVIPANVPAGTYTGTIYFSNETSCNQIQDISITVNAPVAPTIALNPEADFVCTDIDGMAVNTRLKYTATTGNPVTYSIVWDSSPANNFENVIDQALPASPINIVVSAERAPGTYTRTLTVEDANGTVSSGSVFSLNVRQTSSIISNDIITPLSTSTSIQYASLTYSGIIGNPTGYSIEWDQPAIPLQIFNSFTFSSGGGVIDNIKIPANIPPGTYTGRMHFYSDGCYGTHNVSLTINPAVAPTIALNPTAGSACTDVVGITENVSLEYGETTGNPVTYSIAWDSSPANSFDNIIDEVLPETPINIIVPIATVAGTYTATLTVKNANGIVSSGSIFTLNVEQTASIISNDIITPVSASTSIQYATLPYSEIIGNPTGYSIHWDDSVIPRQFFDSFAFSPGGGVIDNIIIPANTPPGTYTGAMNFGIEGCFGTHNVSIVINGASPTIDLASSAQNICFTEEAYTLGYTPLSYEGITGNPTSYSIVWDSTSSLNDFEDVTDAVLPASPITIVTPYANSGTYTGTLIVKDANGVSSAGSAFTVTIGFKPTIDTDAAIHEVYTQPNDQLTTLVYSQSTGAPTSYSIDWDQNANNAFLQDQLGTAYEFEANGGLLDSVLISGGAQEGSYTGTLYLYNEAGCVGQRQVSITIGQGIPTIALASSTENVCLDGGYNGKDTTLSYTGTTGNPTTYSIVWNTSPANTFAAVTDAVLPVSPITVTVPDDTIEGTYTGTLTVKDVNGVSSTGSTFSVTIGVIPAITIYEPIYSVFTSTSAQLTTLVYDQSTGNSTSYYIDWDQAANDALLQDQPSTPNTFTDGGDINTIQVSANAQAGSYSGTIYIVDGFCSGSHPVSITIDPSPSAKTAVIETTNLDSLKNPITVSALNKVISVDTPNQIIDKVYVFNVSGNLIYEKSGVSDTKLVISDLRSGNQVLVVKVVLNNSQTETRKIIF